GGETKSPAIFGGAWKGRCGWWLLLLRGQVLCRLGRLGGLHADARTNDHARLGLALTRLTRLTRLHRRRLNLDWRRGRELTWLDRLNPDRRPHDGATRLLAVILRNAIVGILLQPGLGGLVIFSHIADRAELLQVPAVLLSQAELVEQSPRV